MLIEAIGRSSKETASSATESTAQLGAWEGGPLWSAVVGACHAGRKRACRTVAQIHPALRRMKTHRETHKFNEFMRPRFFENGVIIPDTNRKEISAGGG